MPSSTFLNLPVEKQEKLLEAATREFSRRPFSEASINQIIKDAGIPRGSFYMYFGDKEDLFRYVLQGYMDQMLMVIEELLLREQGDLFLALLGLFDYVQEKREEQHLGDIGAMASIINCNSGIQKSGLLELVEPELFFGRLKDLVNQEQLDLRSGYDLADILGILMVATVPLIYSAGPARPSRAHFQNVLEILKRGMGAKPAANLSET